MKLFAQKTAVTAQTEAKMNPVQLTEEQLDQVSGGCNDIGPIGGLFNFPNSGAQPSAPKHHSGGGGSSIFSGIHIEI